VQHELQEATARLWEKPDKEKCPQRDGSRETIVTSILKTSSLAVVLSHNYHNITKEGQQQKRSMQYSMQQSRDGSQFLKTNRRIAG
jgi:hypothetical protein